MLTRGQFIKGCAALGAYLFAPRAAATPSVEECEGWLQREMNAAMLELLQHRGLAVPAECSGFIETHVVRFGEFSAEDWRRGVLEHSIGIDGAA